MMDGLLPFAELGPGVGIGAPAPGGWESVADCPLLVVVGVTGAGKSTALQAVSAAGLDYCLLPDRRALTDRLIIPRMQAGAGEELRPVSDRRRRFEYTRAYRQENAGGMAHALAQLWIDPAVQDGALLFDGLRGADEVTHAATLLPHRIARGKLHGAMTTPTPRGIQCSSFWSSVCSTGTGFPYRSASRA